MKTYLITVMFLLFGHILYSQEEEITMVVSKYSNNTIEQTGFLDQKGKKIPLGLNTMNQVKSLG